MTLKDKINEIEDTVYGANWRNLIKALRFCIKQREQANSAYWETVIQNDELRNIQKNITNDNQNSDLLAILNGEDL
jgi:hypothetical protein